jgi:hypothetical protein
MVNSKDFNQEYNVYYKQSLDDDSPPYPGMIPKYKFMNGRLVGQVDQLPLFKEDIGDDISTNEYIYGYVLFLPCILFTLVFLKFMFI